MLFRGFKLIPCGTVFFSGNWKQCCIGNTAIYYKSKHQNLVSFCCGQLHKNKKIYIKNIPYEQGWHPPPSLTVAASIEGQNSVLSSQKLIILLTNRNQKYTIGTLNAENSKRAPARTRVVSSIFWRGDLQKGFFGGFCIKLYQNFSYIHFIMFLYYGKIFKEGGGSIPWIRLWTECNPA